MKIPGRKLRRALPGESAKAAIPPEKRFFELSPPGENLGRGDMMIESAVPQ
jgi:hypothetical protein